MSLKTKVSDTYNKYDKFIREAHMKIIQLEKVNKNRTSKENDAILKEIDKIIEEVLHDN